MLELSKIKKIKAADRGKLAGESILQL